MFDGCFLRHQLFELMAHCRILWLWLQSARIVSAFAHSERSSLQATQTAASLALSLWITLTVLTPSGHRCLLASSECAEQVEISNTDLGRVCRGPEKWINSLVSIEIILPSVSLTL